MDYLRRICASMAFAGAFSTGAVCQTSHASQHLWDIKEVYTNFDGSVQFIELFTNAGGQQVLLGHNIVATSTVGGVSTVKEFLFPSNLSLLPPNPSSTLNRHMLVATPGFAALAGGVTPDYTLNFTPAGGPFFNPNADSIEIKFAHFVDIETFAGSALPKDGVNSLTDSTIFTPTATFVAGVNSPTNFQNMAGSVNLPPPSSLLGDFTGDNMVNGADLAVWRANFGATGAPTVSLGNADADGDVDGQDYLIWQRQLGAPPAAAAINAVPEPAAAWLAVAAIAGLAWRNRIILSIADSGL